MGQHHVGIEKRVQEVQMGQETQAVLIPAMLFGEPVKGDASVSTGTLEKPFDAVMPVIVMLFADAGLQRLEVGVGALHKTNTRGQEL